MFGISEPTMLLLHAYFHSQLDIIQVRVYGSRAKGTHKRGSDIDLAVFSHVDHDISGRVKAELNDLPTPYLFDVTDYAYIQNEMLKDHIDRVSKILYCREKEIS